MYKLTKKEESLISEFQHHILNFYLFLEHIQNVIKPIHAKCYDISSEYCFRKITNELPHQYRGSITEIEEFLERHFIKCFQDNLTKRTNLFLKNIEIIKQEAKNNFLISDKLSEIIENHYDYFMEKFKETEIKTLDMLYKGAEYLNQEKIDEIKRGFRNYVTSQM